MNEPTHTYLVDDLNARDTLINHMFSSVPHVKSLGIQQVSLERNSAKGKLRYRSNLIGDTESGALHTGVLISLIDTISGLAAFCALPEYEMIATLDLRLDSFKPSIPGKDIYAVAECYKLTRSIAFVKGTIYHETPDDPLTACVATFFRMGRKGTASELGVNG